MEEWSNYDIHEKIISNLDGLNFTSPTEIQKKILVYTKAKVDLVIQARTGEGKTLCYGIPIVNFLLNAYSFDEERKGEISPVALILVPTRELGVQVKNHLTAILKENQENNYHKIKIANVLGGFAKPKQIKILNKYNPEIIIATPGRLWEIIGNEESPLLEKMAKLKFLVIDEADRMTEKGHFGELKNILNHIYNKIESAEIGKTKIKSKIEELTGSASINNEEENQQILAALKKNKNLNIDLDDIEEIDPFNIIPEEAIDETNLNEVQQEEDLGTDEVLDQRKMSLLKKKDEAKMTENVTLKRQVPLRTILCSATIEQVHKKVSNPKKKNKSGHAQKEESSFNNLIKNLKFFNKLIYVKLNTGAETNVSDNHNEGTSSQIDSRDIPSFILPEKLQLDCFKTDSSTKDYHLYHLLKENDGKKIIIFTNSISHTKKLHSIFSYFNEFKTTCLHSKMQQSHRIKNLERFQNGNVNILFCTDVGARGLDISQVDIVLHYHIPKTTEVFIHRSGRTARAKKEGKVVSLISEKEINLYKKIMFDLNYKEFTMKSMNYNQLEKYKSMFEYAKNIERDTHQMLKKTREKQWFEKTADQCDVIYDDEDEEEEETDAYEKMLNKKRKLINRKELKNKKVYHKIISTNVKRTSFMTPDLVHKLNSLIDDKNLHGMNLTKAIYEANQDASTIKSKGKQRKKRYLRRRK